jgi:hypothetical protein
METEHSEKVERSDKVVVKFYYNDTVSFCGCGSMSEDAYVYGQQFIIVDADEAEKIEETYNNYKIVVGDDGEETKKIKVSVCILDASLVPHFRTILDSGENLSTHNIYGSLMERKKEKDDKMYLRLRSRVDLKPIGESIVFKGAKLIAFINDLAALSPKDIARFYHERKKIVKKSLGACRSWDKLYKLCVAGNGSEKAKILDNVRRITFTIINDSIGKDVPYKIWSWYLYCLENLDNFSPKDVEYASANSECNAVLMKKFAAEYPENISLMALLNHWEYHSIVLKYKNINDPADENGSLLEWAIQNEDDELIEKLRATGANMDIVEIDMLNSVN